MIVGSIAILMLKCDNSYILKLTFYWTVSYVKYLNVDYFVVQCLANAGNADAKVPLNY